MANEKFSALPTVTNSTLSDSFPAIQAGISVLETLAQVVSLSQSNIIQHYAGNPNGNVSGTRYGFCWDTTDSILYICTTSGNSASAIWTAAGTLNSSFDQIKIQTFTSSGLYVPTSGMKYIICEIWGSGGGGGGAISGGAGTGGAGGSGGGGGYSRKSISSSSVGVSKSITIGIGGVGITGGTGSPGGTSNFGSIFSASGGDGVGPLTAVSSIGFAARADGGIGSGGDVNLRGEASRYTLNLANNGGSFGVPGGSAPMMKGINNASILLGGDNSAPGGSGAIYGQGGAGGVVTGTGPNAAGSNGGNGLIVITEFLT